MVKLYRKPGLQCLLPIVIAALVGKALGLGMYDPCTTPGLATKGKGIFMGMAFWPGGTIADWGIISETVANATAPLYPCTTSNNWNTTGLSDQAYLTSQGVVFATFELEVDSLMALRINYTDTLPLYTKAYNNDSASIVSAVMFRGGFRSEARYIVSEDTAYSKGVGWVTSLAGIMKFSKGALTYLQWNDMTCNKCGGKANARCIQVTTGTDAQHSCGTVASTCGVNGTDCSLQTYVGASGDDRNGIAFNSGWMIQEINRFSVLSLYDNSKEDLTSAASSNADAVIGETPTTSSSSTALVA
ncbi:hypothetical protein WJX82_009021 [Trebouxia sp. C0006]